MTLAAPRPPVAPVPPKPSRSAGPRAGVKSRKRLVAAAVGVLVLAGIGWFTVGPGGGRGGGPVAGMQWATVELGNLDITLKNNGELQSVNNLDVISEVEGQTTIQTVVKEGSFVHKGDVIVQLDGSQIRQKVEDTTLDLQKAEADLTTAREVLEIQKSQNSANLEGAEVNLQLVNLDLRQYIDGTYPQSLADARTAVQSADTDLSMAQITLANRQTDFKQIQELAARGYLTATDVKLREIDLITARNAVAKSTNALEQAKTVLSVLTSYKRPRDEAEKRNNVSQAEQRLVRTRRENAANLAQKAADLQAKEQAFTVQNRRLERFKEQLAACTIKAPADGLVVYSSSVDRNAQTPIQDGATVRERQMILRLPDTSVMKAVIRVQDSQVSRLREGLRCVVRITGYPRPLTATLSKISVLADNGQRWWNPDLKEYPVDIVLDETPPNLKPGVSVETVVQISRLENVVLAPVGAIYSAGTKAYVFVEGPAGKPRPQVVEIGAASEQSVRLSSGIEPGTRVLLLQAGQGRELLSAAGIKEEPASRPGARERRGGGNAGAAVPTAATTAPATTPATQP